MTNENLQAENDKFRQLMKMAKLGWWEADFKERTYHCSDFLVELFGLVNTNILSFQEFRELIREDYRVRITNEFASITKQEVYEQTFPVYTKYGVRWVQSKLNLKGLDKEGNLTALGFLQCVDDPEKANKEEGAAQRVNNLLYQQNSISRSLLSFLQEDDITEVINKILGDLLIQFNAGRVYIVEYDWEAENQSCTYEVVSREELREKPNLQKISFEYTQWWTEQLTSLKPIILFNLDELPLAISDEKEILEAQSIKSMMVVPLRAKDKIWGYAGIDTVDDYHSWSNEDYQWFSSLTNIVSICMELRKSELQAQQDKRYMQNLYKYMPIGYLRMKVIYENENPVDFLFLDVNKAVEKIIGYTDSELVGKKASELEGVNVTEELIPLLEVITSGNYKKINYHFPKQGTYSDSILYSPQKDIVVTLMSDTTETYKAHEAMERSEKLFRNIFDNLPVGIELYDKDAYLIDANDIEAEIFGLNDKKDILGINLFEHPVLPMEVKKILREGKKADFNSRFEFSKIGDFYTTKKKKTIDLITKIVPLYSKQNNLQNYMVINIDNTETTNAYGKIQEFEEFFSVIADFAKVGYFKWNPLTKEGFAINQWFKNLGKPEDSQLTTIEEIYEHLHPDDLVTIKDFYQEALLGKAKSFQKEIRIINADDSIKWLRCSIMVRDYISEENVIELTGVNFDITELKDIEEKLIIAKNKAETLDQLKSAFLANMSHEIRTPLNAIVGFSNLLVEAENIDERKEYINIVQENNELLLQLISDILDLSKIEAGTFEFVKTGVNVNALCRDIVMSFTVKANKSVRIIFDNSLPEYFIYSDRNRLIQVITNFLNNALKFTPNGLITLGYRIKDKTSIEFYVQDTGIGISEERMPTVFDRFVKLNTFAQGTGLGLSICKSIVEQMEGEIGVESELGVGSRFWFTHPYDQESVVDEKENYSIMDNLLFQSSLLASNKKPLILIAEDTDSNYLLISTILKKDYKLVRAMNGKEAVELFKEHRPNLILMDIKMPEMDGIEATSLIREIDKQIPIIAVTAFAFDRDKQRTREVGCNDFISKPISGTILKDKIKKWLSI